MIELINFKVVLHMVALLSTGIVYGSDVFFAVVGKKAASKTDDKALLQVMGHIHEAADAKMPFIGVTSVLSTAALFVWYGPRQLAGQLALTALIALIAHLLIYIRIAKPVNQQMIDAVKYGRLISNVRQLQLKWDSVIIYRAILLTIAMLGLLIIPAS